MAGLVRASLQDLAHRRIVVSVRRQQVELSDRCEAHRYGGDLDHAERAQEQKRGRVVRDQELHGDDKDRDEGEIDLRGQKGASSGAVGASTQHATSARAPAPITQHRHGQPARAADK